MPPQQSIHNYRSQKHGQLTWLVIATFTSRWKSVFLLSGKCPVLIFYLTDKTPTLATNSIVLSEEKNHGLKWKWKEPK